jgi:hypothetical protein
MLNTGALILVVFPFSMQLGRLFAYHHLDSEQLDVNFTREEFIIVLIIQF